MKSARVLPVRLQRSIAPERLGPDDARVLQHGNVLGRPGKLVRAKGVAMSQVTGSATTVNGAGIFEDRAGKKIVIDGSTAGTVRMTPGDGTVLNGGPLPEWNDSNSAET